MSLWLSGHWQSPHNPGDLGDAHSFLIGQTALPNLFNHQPGPSTSSPSSPSLPLTGASWPAFDTASQLVQRQPGPQDYFHLQKHDSAFATCPAALNIDRMLW